MSTKPARAAGLYPRLGVSSPFDAHHDLVTSSLISPLALVILRLTLGTYALFVTLFQLIWDAVKTDGADGCVPQFSIGIHCAATHAPTAACFFGLLLPRTTPRSTERAIQILLVLHAPLVHRLDCLSVRSRRADAVLCVEPEKELSTAALAASSAVPPPSALLNHHNLP